jgi:phosphoketolase
MQVLKPEQKNEPLQKQRRSIQIHSRRLTPIGVLLTIFRSGRFIFMQQSAAQAAAKLSDVKPLVVGHWGTTPGQNFIYVHLNRVISKMT